MDKIFSAHTTLTSPNCSPAGWLIPRPPGDRSRFRLDQYHLNSDQDLVKDIFKELEPVVKQPGKRETWKINKARKIVRSYLLVPALEGRDACNMTFASLGTEETPRNLPTKLISSATKALGKLFPNESPQFSRNIVLQALEGLRKQAKKAPRDNQDMGNLDEGQGST